MTGKEKKKVLVTGVAGFIGAALVKSLADGYEVVGIDNLNTYYDTQLKLDRLADLGIRHDEVADRQRAESSRYPSFAFVKLDLTDREGMCRLFDEEHFDLVVNLAGQAGVRYSIENPYAYVESNVLGFLNVLENCRRCPVEHLLYASSSSVYGMNTQVPYAEDDRTDSPVSLYAATKKADELMAHAYCKLYGFPATGLRFFTVYGPWGRPDMAPSLFMKAILIGEPIRVFNHGDLKRDFTYIDDIVAGVRCVLEHPSQEEVPHRVYNIGHSSPVQLLDFIRVIEQVTGKEAVKQMCGMQAGDVYCTYADVSRLEHDFGYRPAVSLEEGIRRFYDWYKDYYKMGQ